MTLFNHYGKFASQFLLLCLLLSVAVLPAQKPSVPNVKGQLSFCGSLHSQRAGGDVRSILPTELGENNLFTDRFGNYYSEEDLSLPKGSSLENSNDIKLQTGYFNPIYTNVPADVQGMINNILLDVSAEIQQRQGIDECSQGYTLNLDILWGDFGTDTAEVWVENDISNLPPPASGILGIGSPFYSRAISSQCLGLAADRPFAKINGGWILRPDLIDGRILLNSNVDAYAATLPGEAYEYWINDATNDPNRPNDLEFDLHTIFLHELFHVLGIASRIDPDLAASSRYDLELRVQNTAGNNSPLLIPDPVTPGCYTGHPEINDFLFNNCNDDRSIGFRASDEIAMQTGAYSVDEVGNGFSHFTNICGSNINYLMTPGFGPGQAVRDASPEEYAIFCDMGYQVTSIDCEGCFVLGWNDNNGRVSEQDACIFLPDICAGVPTTFSLSQLTRLHTNGEVEWGNPFTTIMDDNNLAGSTIDFLIEGDNVTITVSPNSQGDLFVYFPVTACDDDQVVILTHAFAVSAVCNTCPLIQEATCENISCTTDFEDYPYSNSFITFGEVTRWPGSQTIITPRLRHTTSPNNNHLFAPLNTPITLQLSSPVAPGCEVTINLDAVLANQGGTLEFWGSNVRMCSATEIPVGVPFNCMDVGTDCGDGIFVPRCLGTTGEIAAGAPRLTDFDAASPLPFEDYSFTFTNNSDDALNFIYLFAPSFGSWIDNITITTDCPVDLTTTVTFPASFCAGDVQQVTFEICNNSTETTTISGLIEETSDWVFLNTFDDLELAVNSGCVTTTISVRPNSNIEEGDYELNLLISATNQCGLIDDISETFNLTVNNPDPNISSTADIPASFCSNVPQTISFEICNDGTDPMTVFPLISQAAPGWDFTANNPVTLLESGNCVNFNFGATPGVNTPEGGYDFNLEIRAQNQCGRTEEVFFPFTLNLATEDCIQQFDCDVPGAFLVGQTNCNRRISDIAISNNLPQGFCPEPDVVVTWPATSLSNATIIVENELIIDKNYTFNNCEFIMRPNSRITVASGRTLRITGNATNQSWLHGCTALWEGINISGTGRIIIFNTRIQDATIAINATQNARIRLAAMTLADNGIGIQIGGDKDDTNVSVEMFVGVQLIRENALMPYTGTEPYTPTSIGVRTIDNFIGNTFGFVTDETPQSDLWNRQRIIYRNLEVGITIEGGEPKNIVHSLFEQTGAQSGTGIEIEGANVIVTGMGEEIVSFSNLRHSIYAPAPGPNTTMGTSYINATANLFDRCRIGVRSEGDGRVDINNNTFTNVGRAAITYRNDDIQFVDPMSISGNTILLDAPGQTGGINVVNNRTGNSGTTLINDNFITLSGVAGIGIRLLGNSMSLSGNNISTTNANSLTTGIEFREGRRNEAFQNTISGTGANSSSVGITVGSQGEANPYLRCNLLDNLADGIAVLSTGTGLRIISNEFAGNMRAGVYFGPQHTSFLRHPNARNQWSANFVVGALVSDLPANTPNAATILSNQRWTIASNLYPPEPAATLLNLPASLVSNWVAQGPAASLLFCPPLTGGLTAEPEGGPAKSLSSETGKGTAPTVADLKISPNPSRSSLVTVQVPELANEASLAVVDIYGRTLRSIKVAAGRAGQGKLTLELPEKGIYFVVLRETSSGNAPIVKRVVRN